MSRTIMWHDSDGNQHKTELSYRPLFPTLYTFDLGVCPVCGGDADVIRGIDENDPDDFISCCDVNCGMYRAEE